MNIEVELPDLGDTAGDSATISEWHVEEGEFVHEKDRLVEVVAGDETFDIPAPTDGVLVEWMVAEGELVRVGDVLAILEARDDDDFQSDEDE